MPILILDGWNILIILVPSNWIMKELWKYKNSELLPVGLLTSRTILCYAPPYLRPPLLIRLRVCGHSEIKFIHFGRLLVQRNSQCDIQQKRGSRTGKESKDK